MSETSRLRSRSRVDVDGTQSRVQAQDEDGDRDEDQDGNPGSSRPSISITAEQRARMERNRQRALMIRQRKEGDLSTAQLKRQENQRLLMADSRKTYTDSGGGFLVEQDNEPGGPDDLPIVVDPMPPEDPEDLIRCQECRLPFVFSELLKKFDAKICDTCNNPNGIHQLITRTEAKSEYLLKDCDLDRREPALKFIVRKNPHYKARGDMRLYLRLQVEQRALDVWGSEEELEAERERRSSKRTQVQESRYSKKMKTLRMSVRSSLYAKKLQDSIGHEHDFGDEEEYDSDEDQYRKTCKTCSYVMEYEKM